MIVNVLGEIRTGEFVDNYLGFGRICIEQKTGIN